MSYGRDYRNRSYPGQPQGPDDLTDEAQMLGLGPRPGDTEATHTTLNHPWGKVVKLHGDGKSVGLVDTEVFPRPFPWAIQARFSTDGITFTPTVPSGWGGTVTFRFIKSFDVKTGPAPETFVLEADDPLPLCALIARKLAVSVQIDGESVLDLWVQFVVCPTTQIDCADIVGPASATTRLTPFTDGVATRIPATSAPTTLIPAETRRAYALIANMSAVNLFIRLGDGVSTTPGDELATIILPPGAFAGYEVLSYTGVITMKFDADDGTGYALVTQGLYPP